MKRMRRLGVSVRKVKALPVKMETETLINKEREILTCFCVLTDISSKLCFIGRHLTSWVMP